jgi:hypothetical protein
VIATFARRYVELVQPYLCRSRPAKIAAVRAPAPSPRP